MSPWDGKMDGSCTVWLGVNGQSDGGRTMRSAAPSRPTHRRLMGARYAVGEPQAQAPGIIPMCFCCPSFGEIHRHRRGDQTRGQRQRRSQP